MLTWIRNLLGIRKDVIDTNKAKIDTLKAELEVDKLEDEASERNLITRATLDDVKKYDPKTESLLKKIATTTTRIALLALILIGILRLFKVEIVVNFLDRFARIFR